MKLHWSRHLLWPHTFKTSYLSFGCTFKLFKLCEKFKTNLVMAKLKSKDLKKTHSLEVTISNTHTHTHTVTGWWRQARDQGDWMRQGMTPRPPEVQTLMYGAPICPPNSSHPQIFRCLTLPLSTPQVRSRCSALLDAWGIWGTEMGPETEERATVVGSWPSQPSPNPRPQVFWTTPYYLSGHPDQPTVNSITEVEAMLVTVFS